MSAAAQFARGQRDTAPAHPPAAVSDLAGKREDVWRIIFMSFEK